ncbi:MAG: hypothetical protein HFJ02_05805 [Bacilli bacterium]|nr:hypothetical protein [Bacilli bacterium]
MEFLYRLYSNNYFGIGLFIVITILAFSFLVILFFGKKDEKARESKKLIDHIENRTNEEKTTVEPISINRTETKENIIETPIMDEKIEFKDETSGLGLENKEAFEKIENDLFRSDSFTQNIENTEEPSVYERPLIREEEVYQERTPIIEEKEEENIFSEPALEEKNYKPTPDIFSSVYKSNEEEKKETVPEETMTMRPIPIKPEFALPKKVELPKLNKTSDSNSNIINTSFKEASNMNNPFLDIEEESYTIDK